MSARPSKRSSVTNAGQSATFTVPTDMMSYVESTSVNMRTHLIIITRDKVELCLRGHAEHLGRRHAWVTPCSVLLSLLATLAASSFHAAFGMEAAAWKALFVLSAIATAIWLCVELVRRPRCKTVQDLIQDFQAGSVPYQVTANTIEPATPRAADEAVQ